VSVYDSVYLSMNLSKIMIINCKKEIVEESNVSPLLVNAKISNFCDHSRRYVILVEVSISFM
jgi:hypothetical protein